MYIEKKKIEFYFIVPKQYLSILKEKISDVWNNITVDEVGQLPSFADKATKYQMVYEKEDAMSLKVDKRDNYLLQSNLNIVDVLEEKDRVGILYNFLPSSQESFKFSYKATLEKVKKGLPIERNKMGAAYVFKLAIGLIDGLVNDVSEVLAGKKERQNDTLLANLVDYLQGGAGRKPRESTEEKIRNQIIPTQIIVLSESQDKLREINNGRSLANSFDVISDDNKLIPKRLNGKLDLLKYNIGAEINKMSDGECQNFISIPGRELLERHNFIEKVSTHEVQIPEDLQKGVFCIGTNTFRGHKQNAYLTEHHEFKNLLLLLIGPTRSGKTNFLSHLSIDAIDNGECVILFDFIKKNEFSTDVAKCFPDHQVLVIETTDLETIQGMGYNEAQSLSTDPFKRYAAAKLQNTNLVLLINAVKAEGLAPLSSKMKRYLEAAALVVFLNNGAFKDVINCLQDEWERHEWIKKVPHDLSDYMEGYIKVLRELDKYDRDGNLIDTKLDRVDGILDRMNELKLNPYIELMLKKDTSKNINLAEEIQKNQVICIRMKGSHFPTNMEKDVLTTYWLTKIMLALEVREEIVPEDDRLKVNLVIDEIYQVENTEKILKDKLSQIAKFLCKPIVSCHYINQLTYLRSALRSANTSYMLIAGCDEDNFKELKNDLAPFTYETSLKTMPSYHSLNRIKTKDGYATFITKLPGKVEKRVRERNCNDKQKEDVTVGD
ncbi:hypothetical protein ABC255_09755 [Neobacillus sp. 3P2-tot-E-2]|uniref:hypothetical protein n=1 Tax=Neobacillus sp. 3P2-tot-E-2 TaxID=3132212 RepID=UPI00399F716B